MQQKPRAFSTLPERSPPVANRGGPARGTPFKSLHLCFTGRELNTLQQHTSAEQQQGKLESGI